MIAPECPAIIACASSSSRAISWRRKGNRAASENGEPVSGESKNALSSCDRRRLVFFFSAINPPDRSGLCARACCAFTIITVRFSGMSWKVKAARGPATSFYSASAVVFHSFRCCASNREYKLYLDNKR